MIEIHTAKSLSWFFIVLSSLALVGLAFAAFHGGDRSIIGGALLFGAALAVGIHTLLRPRTLLKLEPRQIRLFSGTLWGNTALIAIPREDIRTLAAEKVTDSDGIIYLLRLTTTEPLLLDGSAARWAANAKRHSRFRDDPETVIVWPLQLPNMPTDALNEKLSAYLSAAC
jgi:hypothetical protein